MGYIPITNFHESTSFFAWSIVFIFFVLQFRYKVSILCSFVMPIVFVLMLSSSMLPQEIKPLSPVLQSYWLTIHTVVAFLGNAAFALACGIGTMYLVQEHYVKSKQLGGLFARLPSLQTLDALNYKLITLGFPLLTIAIICPSIHFPFFFLIRAIRCFTSMTLSGFKEMESMPAFTRKAAKSG